MKMIEDDGALKQREMKYFATIQCPYISHLTFLNLNFLVCTMGIRTWLLSFWEILIEFFILCPVTHASYLEPTLMG